MWHCHFYFQSVVGVEMVISDTCIETKTTAVKRKTDVGRWSLYFQGSHYFQIRGRSDFSFRELTGRSGDTSGRVKSLMETVSSPCWNAPSPRFLCRPTSLYIFARAVGRQRAMHTENSGFASPTLGQHISTFRGYQILFSIRNPYINRFTNHFSIHS